MARFTNPNPTTVNPKLPNSVVHDMEVLNRSIGISLNLMTRIVLRETLANPARRDEIIAEIARERSCRRYGDSTAVYTWMNHETARAFAELMATTGARATMVARAIITVGCSGGLGRFRKRFLAESARLNDVEERQVEKIRVLAARHGFDLQERA
ncbi:hypothetical protein [Burkholderia vietnamiensis]|uniref:hypothetical protein n=1 Tax=Burkholderia vietnamiensis TaxID=60552 RepID=UPI001CF3162A|nr:hypothetical protein [Burkholderia vietnamiensis]MCA8448950.1 hypothetical protein [Burkholderia vietnamiensis]